MSLTTIMRAKKNQPLPVKRDLYNRRVGRLRRLLALDAPAGIIASEALILLDAVYGSYWRVLRLAFVEWREHLWFDRVSRPYWQLRCRWWCWWNEQPPTAFWDLQELKDEAAEPEDQRCPAFDDETRH